MRLEDFGAVSLTGVSHSQSQSSKLYPVGNPRAWFPNGSRPIFSRKSQEVETEALLPDAGSDLPSEPRKTVAPPAL